MKDKFRKVISRLQSNKLLTYGLLMGNVMMSWRYDYINYKTLVIILSVLVLIFYILSGILYYLDKKDNIDTKTTRKNNNFNLKSQSITYLFFSQYERKSSGIIGITLYHCLVIFILKLEDLGLLAYNIVAIILLSPIFIYYSGRYIYDNFVIYEDIDKNI